MHKVLLCSVYISVRVSVHSASLYFHHQARKRLFNRNSGHVVNDCAVREREWEGTRENGNMVGKGKWINRRPCHPGLFSRPLYPCLSSIFSPFRSWALDHFSFPSPLHSAQFCHPAKETNQRALFSFVSLCLSLLVVRSAPYCLSTLHFDPCSLWCHTGSKGCWEATRGRTSSCPASIFCHPKECRKNAHSSLSGECFPCLEKVSPVSRSLSCPFKEFQSGSLIPYFSSKLIWCVCTCWLSCYRACYLHQ